MKRTYILVDTDRQICPESFEMQETFRNDSGAIRARVTKRRLRGGVQDGIDVVEIDSGRFAFTVLLTRGMNILRARCDDLDLKWDSPVAGPVHPNYVPVFAPSGCGWLEGFCEWVARCGLESNGAPEFSPSGVLKYPLHGRLSNLPARRVELTYDDETGVIELTGEIMETSVFGRRFLLRVAYSITVGSTSLKVEDRVVNLASTADEFELLYHINTGYPLVSPGAKFLAAFNEMCPRNQDAVAELGEWERFREPIPGCPETCYFLDLAPDQDGIATVALVNSSDDRGLALSFSKSDFPRFILWKTQRPNGDIYVSGLEPAVNYPNTRSFEKAHGRLVPIDAGETKTFRFTLSALTSAEAVASVSNQIEVQRATVSGKVIPAPVAEWCE